MLGVLLECAYDQNTIKLKIRAKQEKLLPRLHKDQIILILRGSLRISKKVEIELHVDIKQAKSTQVIVIGQIDRRDYQFEPKDHTYSQVMIFEIPTQAIVRNIL